MTDSSHSPTAATDRTSPLRLLVVDDHEVVRQGLVALLDRRPGFHVVAEAGTVEEAMTQARRHQPDLVIMDVRLPDGSGIEACRDIRAELPATRVVMLTSFPDDEAPDYWDFAYFAFTIGMCAQVSDVTVSSKTIRRTVLTHSIISFLFNAALLALTVNIAASAI